MNIFIENIIGEANIFFFTEKEVCKKLELPRQKAFIDTLVDHRETKEIKNIFVVSGPAPFTSLRNLSVFVNTFKTFSKPEISLFAVPTAYFLQKKFPSAQRYFLSAGKRESFIFENDNFTKLKNTNIPENFLQEKWGGFLNENFTDYLENRVLEISTEEILYPLFLEKEKYQTEKLIPEYGALPNIG